jgi:hypothetical protein
MNYNEFLESKKIVVKNDGLKVTDGAINSHLFDYQHDIVKWSLAKGKSAVFAGTGLGKTRIQLAWAEQIPGDVLILAPLAVSEQTVIEGGSMGIAVHRCYDMDDVTSGINITNYERMEKMDLSHFTGIVLDESSILKAQMGKIRTELITNSMGIPFKLCCTATPAPNDYMELGNHAEFLGVMTETEMLSCFFTHDGGNTSKWRLKHHAVKEFWNWVASWAVMMTNPSDLGYDGTAFELPPIQYKQITIHTKAMDGFLFSVEAQTLQERQRARRESMAERVKACADLVNSSDEQWLVWCNLNNESEELARQIQEAVEVKGSDSAGHKTNSMLGFADGSIKKLISKPSICGFGMNFQSCHNMCFVGLSDSFEQYYQAVRRCWRFGQRKPVNVYFITADTEGAVVANIQRKERDFNDMLKGMISATQEITAENIRQTQRQRDEYKPTLTMKLPEWLRSVA